MKHYIQFIEDTISLKTNDYLNVPITKIYISYGIREGILPVKTKMLSEIMEKHVFQNYKHYKLPVTMNPLD
jgi:hypothetical protein